MNVSFDPRDKARDYERAREFLILKYPQEIADVLVQKLRIAPVTWHKPADIFRAAGISPLPLDDPSVKHVAEKIRAGHRVDPVLMASVHGKTVIADGSHHAALFYHISPHRRIPVQVADLNSRAT